MPTAEERLRILKMVERGQISAEDAAKLLEALEERDKAELSPASSKVKARWFRVRITDLKSGRAKVNVNIPMELVSIGLKLRARFASGIEGFNADRVIEMIREGTRGKLVDVEDDESGERVEIFVE
ncbi:MAG: hypothetical protein RML36_15055 [Anaerolineae bacterium]|nr:hypothetical protein [Anaerolineae bacterium]MDW8100790.1 hypothetical protein [Anaerolineae bacterium]